MIMRLIVRNGNDASASVQGVKFRKELPPESIISSNSLIMSYRGVELNISGLRSDLDANYQN